MPQQAERWIAWLALAMTPSSDPGNRIERECLRSRCPSGKFMAWSRIISGSLSQWLGPEMANHKVSNVGKNKSGNGRSAPSHEPPQPFRFRDGVKALGPGLITGAADDDPSGIGTYSQAGAQLGYGIGWTMLLTFPLMVAIQEIAGRIGAVTGRGISGNICRHYSVVVLNVIVALLFIANTINIAADLGAMADATRLLIGGHGILYVLLFGVTSVAAQIFLDYKLYVAVLKWLTLSLFTYV